MIKISLQALSLQDEHKFGDDILDAAFKMASELRLDGVDLEDRFMLDTSQAYLRNVRMRALRLGLRLNYIGLYVNLRAGADEIEDEVRRAKEVIGYMPHLGVQVLRLLGNNVPDGETDESFWPVERDRYRRIVDYAAPRGITVGVHNHNHGAIPATGAQIVRLLEEIDGPYLAGILDTGQFRGSPGANGGGGDEQGHASEELYRSIEIAAPYAQIVRTKFYRIVDGEEKWLDYRRIVPVLKRAGFNGWFSIVYEGKGSGVMSSEAVPKAVAHLREVLGAV